MNIPALPPVITSSIAGVDRAASEKMIVSSTVTNSATPVRHDTVDSIDKGNASDDSGADGRQTLDTFERRSHDEQSGGNEDSAPTPAELPHDLSRAGLHLDFQA